MNKMPENDEIKEIKELLKKVGKKAKGLGVYGLGLALVLFSLVALQNAGVLSNKPASGWWFFVIGILVMFLGILWSQISILLVRLKSKVKK